MNLKNKMFVLSGLNFNMKKKNNVLVVGCHPDDIELGCGGTISKHVASGDKVIALIMTNGERGSHDVSLGECKKSLKEIGISEYILAGFPDGFLKDDYEIVSLIENVIKKNNVNRVYTHYPEDTHQDHRYCSRAVSSAARRTPEILFFEGPSTSPSFEPHLFIELSEEDLSKKLNALNHYQTQIKKGIVNTRAIKSLATYYGAICNKGYAEAFVLNHMIKEGQDV